MKALDLVKNYGIQFHFSYYYELLALSCFDLKKKGLLKHVCVLEVCKGSIFVPGPARKRN